MNCSPNACPAATRKQSFEINILGLLSRLRLAADEQRRCQFELVETS